MFPVSPINFLDHHEDARVKKRTVRRRAGMLLIMAAIAVVLSSQRLRQPFLPPPIERAIARVEQFSFFHLATSADQKLSGEENGRINILLMGIGGGDHEGPLLTDTLLLASMDFGSKRLAMLSIPRDLVVPQGGGAWRKINSVLANTEARSPGTGNDAVRTKVEEITAQSIPYFIRLDFDGFIQLIDAIGGITIDVERTLDDRMYPIFGREEDPVYANRFEHLVIPKGTVTMDGSLALKYVRSRHAFGVEGSDFARSRRQQKVLLAIKEKVFSFETIFSPRRWKSIEDILSAHIATNLQPWEVLRLRTILQTVDTENIIHPPLDDSPGSLLTNARGEGDAYILVPRGGNFNKLAELESTIFLNEGNILPPPAEPKQPISPPEPTSANPTPPALPNMLSIILLNGTEIEGHARTVAKRFETENIVLQNVDNTPVKGYEESILYIRPPLLATDAIVSRIQSIVPATTTSIFPAWAASYSADLILVLGTK